MTIFTGKAYPVPRPPPAGDRGSRRARRRTVFCTRCLDKKSSVEAEIQRARIVAAMLEVACERGVANATVGQVVARSGVSRRTFYETFADREACFAAALEQAVAHVCERVLPAWRCASSWRERVRAALVALLVFLEEEPVVGRVLIAESRACRARVLAQVTRAIDTGRAEARPGAEPPPLTAEGAVGGALAIVYARLTDRPPAQEPRAGWLVELVGPLMSMIALAYLGAAAARRELERPVPDAPVGSFELTLPQGAYSALDANTNLCTVKGGLRMPTLFTAQNGATIKQNTPINTTGCPKHKAKKRAKRRRAKKAGHDRRR